MLDVYVGWDSREHEAFRVAAHSVNARSSRIARVHRLDAADLYQRRLYWRPIEKHNGHGAHDHLSGYSQSTEFAVTRFLVPYIHKTGWALFVDCDMVFLGDVAELFALADERYAAMVVKHDYTPQQQLKMDGQPQRAYPRKNWSSVILWNCDHVAHTRLGVARVNQWPRQCLHGFGWMTEDEIGELPGNWNWLVGEQPKPLEPKLAHYTLGGPWLPGWKPAEHDEIWLAAQRAANGVRDGVQVMRGAPAVDREAAAGCPGGAAQETAA